MWDDRDDNRGWFWSVLLAMISKDFQTYRPYCKNCWGWWWSSLTWQTPPKDGCNLGRTGSRKVLLKNKNRRETGFLMVGLGVFVLKWEQPVVRTLKGKMKLICSDVDYKQSQCGGMKRGRVPLKSQPAEFCTDLRVWNCKVSLRVF